MVLDGDPQAVHGIAAGPLAERDVVWHCVTPSLASTPSAHKAVARRFGCRTGQKRGRTFVHHIAGYDCLLMQAPSLFDCLRSMGSLRLRGARWFMPPSAAHANT
jgi:hypothetical protein